jgi:hypothetical protein
VLAGARLGDDARLAHAPRQQHLADAVVDLVRAGVAEVLALENSARLWPAACADLGGQRGGLDPAVSGGRRSRAAAVELFLEVASRPASSQAAVN